MCKAFKRFKGSNENNARETSHCIHVQHLADPSGSGSTERDECTTRHIANALDLLLQCAGENDWAATVVVYRRLTLLPRILRQSALPIPGCRRNAILLLHTLRYARLVGLIRLSVAT